MTVRFTASRSVGFRISNYQFIKNKLTSWCPYEGKELGTVIIAPTLQYTEPLQIQKSHWRIVEMSLSERAIDRHKNIRAL
jgi:hypothetical protein